MDLLLKKFPYPSYEYKWNDALCIMNRELQAHTHLINLKLC